MLQNTFFQHCHIEVLRTSDTLLFTAGFTGGYVHLSPFGLPDTFAIAPSPNGLKCQ